MPCYRPQILLQKKDDPGSTILLGSAKEYYNTNADYKQRIMLERAERKGFTKTNSDEVIIPCQKCTGCRLKYSKEWAARCYLESKTSKENYWLTLTYDEVNVPKKLIVNKQTGELGEFNVLYRKDLQDFLKRLRYHYAEKGHKAIRYYGCGEYGTHGLRPHYHVTMFHLPIGDLKIKYIENGGQVTYESDTISKLWGKGIVTINESSWQTLAYTARYMLKKDKGSRSRIWKDLEIQQEFTCCSLKPGIGTDYYLQHRDEIYEHDKIYVMTKKDHVEAMKPPKYFDDKLKSEDPERYKKIHEERRRVAKLLLENSKDRKTDILYFNELEIQERIKQEQIRALKRKLELGE